jgi:hypothetical protein
LDMQSLDLKSLARGQVLLQMEQCKNKERNV